MKICTVCHAEKREIDFYRKEAHCRSCRNKAALAWHHANPDKAKKIVKEWDEKNPGKRAAQSKQWYRDNPDAKKRHAATAEAKNPGAAARMKRNSVLKTAYNMTIEAFDSLLASQNGVCSICAGPAAGRGTFHVDHCHKTGIIRGLLCHHCNVGLGCAKDNPALLRKMANYLECNAKGDY